MSGVLTAGGHFVGLTLWIISLGLLWSGLQRARALPSGLFIPGAIAILPLAFLFRGIFGDVSFTLPWLCALAAGWLHRPKHPRCALFFFASCGLILNLSALGLLATDLYSLGYSHFGGLVILGCLAGASGALSPSLSLTWCVGLWLMISGLTPSSNAFDLAWDVPAILLSVALLLRRSQTN